MRARTIPRWGSVLTNSELAELVHSLRDERVLSIYIDGTAEDFAAPPKYHLDLEHSLKDLRKWLADSSHAEREGFEQCVRLLEERLPPTAGAIRSRGWVAFITRDSVRYAEHLPLVMSTLAVWSTGPAIAPYMRALKQVVPVVVAIADRRKATLFSYARGKLERQKTIGAHTKSGTVSHMGDPPRPGYHVGVRGATGHDEEQRVMANATNRMLKEVVDEALALSGSNGWILTGGVPRTSVELARMIEGSAPGRVLSLESLDIHSTDPEIAAAAEEGASVLRSAVDLKRIEEVIEQATGSGLAALGPAETREALEQSRVRDLYLTHAFVEDHAAEAEDAVRSALSQGACVEEVSREAARQLDGHGGMAARLRYVI